MKRTISRFVTAFLSLLLTIFIAVPSFAASLSPGLQGTLQKAAPDTEISIIINLADKVDVNKINVVAPMRPGNEKAFRRHAIAAALRDKADKTQGPLKALLQGRGGKKMKPLWITNSVAVTVSSSVISELMSMPEIESIELDAVIQASPITPAIAGTPGWNIDRINAPTLWAAGIDGTGAVVASLDSGVDVNHPDLKYRWRGGSCISPPYCPSWYDPYNNITLPYGIPASPGDPSNDTHVHGTHTMGIMVGGTASPLHTPIGVAPGARWISAKIFDDSGNASTSDIQIAFQWALCPGCDPANPSCVCAPSPDVVNNSWSLGAQNTCDTTFQASISTLTAAGIEVIFAAGDVQTPPATSSSSFSPANNLGVFAVGATDCIGAGCTDPSNVIAPYSPLGPSPLSVPPPPPTGCNGGTFPNIVAPGSVIYSSVPVGSTYAGSPVSYLHFSGTSMSAPHVSGAAALLAGAMPALTPAQIEEAFQHSALPLGSPPIPNDTYGYGLLDAEAAYKYAFINFGKGNLPQIAGVPSAVYFVNTSSSDSFTLVIVNQGTADLVISSPVGVSLTGSSDYVITIDGCSGVTVPSLGSCSVTVKFTPTVAGPESAQVSIASNDTTLNVPLRGNDPVAQARVQDDQSIAIVATYPDIETLIDPNNLNNWDIIQMQADAIYTFPPESPVFNLPLGITVSLLGGYDAAFASQIGFTTIQGTLTISKGTVIVGNVIVQ